MIVVGIFMAPNWRKKKIVVAIAFGQKFQSAIFTCSDIMEARDPSRLEREHQYEKCNTND